MSEYIAARGSEKTRCMIATAILDDMRRLGTKTVDEWISKQKNPKQTADILAKMGLWIRKEEK